MAIGQAPNQERPWQAGAEIGSPDGPAKAGLAGGRGRGLFAKRHAHIQM